MSDVGRILVFVGVIIIALGAVLMLAGRANLPVGRLPGDMVYRGRNTVFYFPLATSLILSILLTLLFAWFRR